MKPAIWQRVAKALQEKYSLTWQQARETYNKLKSTEPRKPSLRMVSGLPEKLPKALKGARVQNPAKRAKVQNAQPPAKPIKSKVLAKPEFTKTELDYFRNATKPPVTVELAPKPNILGAAIVPKRQGARNQFEQFLKDAGLPVTAIARNETGKQIAANWRNRGEQEKLVKILQQTFSQIKKRGYMMEQTKERLAKQLEKVLGVKRSNNIWNNIMRQLYGNKPKK